MFHIREVIEREKDLSAQKDEITRLRAALEKIAEGPPRHADVWGVANWAAKIAEDTL